MDHKSAGIGVVVGAVATVLASSLFSSHKPTVDEVFGPINSASVQEVTEVQGGPVMLISRQTNSDGTITIIKVRKDQVK